VSTKKSSGHDNPQPKLAEQDDFAARLPGGCQLRTIKRRAAAMLAKVGLADKAASYPSALSGGQQ
jgi:ABC-type polar amino acid transport system ATPase subunit